MALLLLYFLIDNTLLLLYFTTMNNYNLFYESISFVFFYIFSVYRGINMRYLGKVTSILALRADLEHVYVSTAVYYWACES